MSLRELFTDLDLHGNDIDFIKNLDVRDILKIGSDESGTAITDSTNKEFHMIAPHYDTDEEYVGFMQMRNRVGYNLLMIGKGDSDGDYNVVTDIAFYAAAANNTLSSLVTPLMTIDDEEVEIGIRLEVDGVIWADGGLDVRGGITHIRLPNSTDEAFLAETLSNEYFEIDTNQDRIIFTVPDNAYGFDIHDRAGTPRHLMYTNAGSALVEFDTDIFNVVNGLVHFSGASGLQVDNLTETGTLKIKNLTSGYLPYDNGSILADTNMFYDSVNGRIGINTNSPDWNLDVRGKLKLYYGADDANIAYIWGVDDTTEYLGLGTYNGAAYITAGGSGSTDCEMIFRTANSGSETNQMFLDKDGNLGIGITPSNRLHAYIEDTTSNDITYALRLDHAVTGSSYDNIGVGIDFRCESNYSSMDQLGTLAFINENSSGSDTQGTFVVKVMDEAGGGLQEVMRARYNQVVKFTGTPVYADNAAAKAGGLVDGERYRTSTGVVMEVYT